MLSVLEGRVTCALGDASSNVECAWGTSYVCLLSRRVQRASCIYRGWHSMNS